MVNEPVVDVRSRPRGVNGVDRIVVSCADIGEEGRSASGGRSRCYAMLLKPSAESLVKLVHCDSPKLVVVPGGKHVIFRVVKGGLGTGASIGSVSRDSRSRARHPRSGTIRSR